jgi:hypothetical protein
MSWIVRISSKDDGIVEEKVNFSSEEEFNGYIWTYRLLTSYPRYSGDVEGAKRKLEDGAFESIDLSRYPTPYCVDYGYCNEDDVKIWRGNADGDDDYENMFFGTWLEYLNAIGYQPKKKYTLRVSTISSDTQWTDIFEFDDLDFVKGARRAYEELDQGELKDLFEGDSRIFLSRE